MIRTLHVWLKLIKTHAALTVAAMREEQLRGSRTQTRASLPARRGAVGQVVSH